MGRPLGLPFAPSGVLLGLILSAIAFAWRGISFPSVFDPPHLVLNGLFGLAFFGRLLEFLTKFHQGGAGDLSLFSGLRVRTPAILAQSILRHSD